MTGVIGFVEQWGGGEGEEKREVGGYGSSRGGEGGEGKEGEGGKGGEGVVVTPEMVLFVAKKLLKEVCGALSSKGEGEGKGKGKGKGKGEGKEKGEGEGEGKGEGVWEGALEHRATLWFREVTEADVLYEEYQFYVDITRLPKGALDKVGEKERKEGEGEEEEERVCCMSKFQWFNVNDIPYARMPADDRVWYPTFLLGGGFVCGCFYFHDEVILDHKLRVFDLS